MLFFQAQREAKSNSVKLMLLFSLNAGLISFSNSILITHFLGAKSSQIQIFAISMIFFIGMAMIGLLQSSSGTKLVEAMGGSFVDLKTESLQEKQFLNVVEEMSLASGVPIPKCAILKNESTINAFVSGSGVRDVVVCITAGALNLFNRDELQAVIGHEYSHILNKDIVLNNQLAGVVKGFQIFTKAGNILLSRDRSSKRYSKQKGELNALGIGLILIGYIGYYLGKSLQSMISRQREFLADASSAQYTRNPEALACALAKILNGMGSTLQTVKKHELAHIFFSDPVGTKYFANLFATHPPLRERIQKLVPKLKIEDLMTKAYHEVKPPKENKMQWTTEKILNIVGAPTDYNFNLVSNLVHELGVTVDYLKNLNIAKAALAMVVLYTQEEYQSGIDALLEHNENYKEVLIKIRNEIEASDQKRVLIFQYCLSTLDQLSINQKQDLLKFIKNVCENNKKWSLLELLVFMLSESYLLNRKFNNNLKLEIHKSPEEKVLEIFKDSKDLNFVFTEALFNFIKSKNLEFRRKILETLVSQVDLNNPRAKEELRLFSMYIKVPIPMI